jgi:hypothetical protein
MNMLQRLPWARFNAGHRLVLLGACVALHQKRCEHILRIGLLCEICQPCHARPRHTMPFRTMAQRLIASLDCRTINSWFDRSLASLACTWPLTTVPRCRLRTNTTPHRTAHGIGSEPIPDSHGGAGQHTRYKARGAGASRGGGGGGGGGGSHDPVNVGSVEGSGAGGRAARDQARGHGNGPRGASNETARRSRPRREGHDGAPTPRSASHRGGSGGGGGGGGTASAVAHAPGSARHGRGKASAPSKEVQVQIQLQRRDPALAPARGVASGFTPRSSQSTQQQQHPGRIETPNAAATHAAQNGFGSERRRCASLISASMAWDDTSKTAFADAAGRSFVVVGVLGAEGAGKTTVMRTLHGGHDAPFYPRGEMGGCSDADSGIEDLVGTLPVTQTRTRAHTRARTHNEHTLLWNVFFAGRVIRALVRYNV